MSEFEQWFADQDFYTNMRFIHGDALFTKDSDVYRVLPVQMTHVAWAEKQSEIDQLKKQLSDSDYLKVQHRERRCELNKEVEKLKAEKGFQELEINQLACANQEWQRLNREKELEVEKLKAKLQAEGWDKEAGFKLFFKARDMRGGWHGFEREPEFYKVGGYWFNGGKSKYLHGDEWCDEDTAINSLQALRGES